MNLHKPFGFACLRATASVRATGHPLYNPNLALIELQSQLESVNWLTQSGQLSHYISTFTSPFIDGAAL